MSVIITHSSGSIDPAMPRGVWTRTMTPYIVRVMRDTIGIFNPRGFNREITERICMVVGLTDVIVSHQYIPVYTSLPN